MILVTLKWLIKQQSIRVFGTFFLKSEVKLFLMIRLNQAIYLTDGRSSIFSPFSAAPEDHVHP